MSGHPVKMIFTEGQTLTVDGEVYTVVRVNKASLRASFTRPNGSVCVVSFTFDYLVKMIKGSGE